MFSSCVCVLNSEGASANWLFFRSLEILSIPVEDRRKEPIGVFKEVYTNDLDSTFRIGAYRKVSSYRLPRHFPLTIDYKIYCLSMLVLYKLPDTI